MNAGSDLINVVMVHRCPGEFWSIEELFGTIVRAFPHGISVFERKAPMAGASFQALFKNLWWARRLEGYQLVHQTGDIHYAILGVRRVPVVLTIHDVRFIEEASGLRRFCFFWLWLYLPCLRACKVTVISEFTKAKLLALCPIKPNKVRVIPNCVAPAFTPSQRDWPRGTVRILQVGTTENKNLPRLAEACAGIDIHLTILGNLTSSQERLLHALDLTYENHRNLTREEVVELYHSSDVVVFISTYEGFGMPILEAQAVGRPVLTSNISPMVEVAGEGALKVDPLDGGAIRQALLRLISDESLRSDLIVKGFSNVAQYSAGVVAARYASLYREVLETQ